MKKIRNLKCYYVVTTNQRILFEILVENINELLTIVRIESTSFESDHMYKKRV